MISHGIPDPQMGSELVPGLNAAIETEWQKQQIKLAALVPDGRRIVATKSGHMIPVEQPGLVIGAIEDMLRQIGTRSPRPEGKDRAAANEPVVAGPPGEASFAEGSMKIAGWRRSRFRESRWRSSVTGG